MILSINNVYDYQKLISYDHNSIKKDFTLILQIPNRYCKKTV